ncbi:MAG: LD-carboxypeptidase [Bacteroidota bacterium]|nr:LD-carboxypeptidase [Bacteroidota bacterium]
MNRKNFLTSLIPLLPVLSMAKENSTAFAFPECAGKIPPYLSKGDIIAITCPSGFITTEDIQPAVEKIKQWGFGIRIGATVGARDFTFAGTDEERRNDFQNMLDDPSIKAIMLGRGGYGAVRIIDAIDFKKFSLKPKWIIGFSDATVIHSHLNKNFGIASIHAKMCNSFPADWQLAEQTQIDSIESIRKCLAGDKMQYPVIVNERNRAGSGEGVLVGGNLSILENLAATNSDINTDDKILFIEEVGEYLYNIDRMLWNLKRSGKFNKLKALVIGAMKNRPDDAGEEFGKTVYDMVLEKVKEYGYPVCFDFPVGHQKENYALKCGVAHQLIVNENYVELKEI